MTAQTSFFSQLITVPQNWLRREIIPLLADLKLAIALLLAIALFSISGTVIEQGQTLDFYKANYPESPALFGFLTWKILLTLGLDHVYRTWWFLALLILFGSSLITCTFTRQVPALKTAQTWRFYTKSSQFEKLALSTELTQLSLSSFIPILQKQGYLIFQEGDSLYARKGIIGKIGPIIVHISMIMILIGGVWGSLTGFIAQEMIPSGQTFQVKNIIDAGPFAKAQIPTDWSVKVNRFWINYTPSGEIDQFYSDLSVVDQENHEIDRQTIYVNQPLRYRGVSFYQTDWGISAIRFQLNQSPIFQIPMALLDTGGKGRLWGTWIPLKPDLSEGVSLVVKDLQGTILIYDASGKLINTIRQGMSTEINGIKLTIKDIIGSTGLQIKADPGIPIVYLGFGLLMISVMMSYVSHSQIWLLQQSDRLYLGAKTNRAQVTFEREITKIIDQVAANHSGTT